MRVLISAYACEPNKGSEQGSGWNWVKQIARFHETHVITRRNNRKPIEDAMQDSKTNSLHFIYIDLPSWLKFWKCRERNLYLYYIIWQLIAFFKARRLHRAYHFDCVHHLTFGSFWLPNFLAFLRTKFIWGPIGGAERIPHQFIKHYTLKNRAKEIIRMLFMKFNHKVNPLFIYNCRSAHTIIAKTCDTAEMISARFRGKIYTIVGGGMPFDIPGNGNKEKCNSADHVVRILSVGRLIYLRNFDLAIRAFPLFNRRYKNKAVYTIVGSGPEEQRLRQLVRTIIPDDSIKLVGRLQRVETIQLMQSSDIFLFPSIKDAGPWVIFEAMYFGLPIICLDIAGMRDVIDSTCAVVIKPLNPQQTINEIESALINLSTQPRLRAKMGAAGRRRVLDHYNWEKKGRLIARIYADIV